MEMMTVYLTICGKEEDMVDVVGDQSTWKTFFLVASLRRMGDKVISCVRFEQRVDVKQLSW